MEFFLDSADINEIREAVAMGLCDGVTTNPSLVAKTGRPFNEVMNDIVKTVSGPVSLEATSTDFNGMIREARELSGVAPNVVVKIPLTKEGLRAIKVCSEEGIKTNATLVFTGTQALLAAKSGATFVSPFIGRLDDVSSEGMLIVEQIIQIFDNYGFDTRVIVASIRHPMHVLQAALSGADIATIPFDVLNRLFNHPLTDTGIEKFLKDWKKVPG
jgi:transaldolase